ncbi:hypothetical protein J132_00267 [Termitomyces sp. J132]|nr:hypothetical protein J132_00267 [Termitomyces sp. J132]
MRTIAVDCNTILFMAISTITITPDADAEVQVSGVLAIPIFTCSNSFPIKTLVKKAALECFANLHTEYCNIFTEAPRVEDISLCVNSGTDNPTFTQSKSLRGAGSNSTTLGDVRLPDEPNSITFLYHLNADTYDSHINNMRIEIIKLRQHNLVLSEELDMPSLPPPSKSSRKKSKKNDAVAQGKVGEPSIKQPTNSSVIKPRNYIVADIFADIQLFSDWRAEFHSLKAEIRSVKSDNCVLLRKVESLENANCHLLRKVQNLEDENQHLKDEISTLKDDNSALSNKVETLEKENCDLREETRAQRDRIEQLEKTIHPLNRRITLDKAREKLLQELSLNQSDYSKPADLLEVVKKNIKAKATNDPMAKLHDDALKMIFRSNSIRDAGNVAAHEASEEELGVAVLSYDLTEKQRTLLEAIYEYAFGKKPVLQSN